MQILLSKINRKIFSSIFGNTEDTVYFLLSVEIEFYISITEPLSIDSTKVSDIYTNIKSLGYKRDIIVDKIEEEDGFNQFEIQTVPTDNAPALAGFIFDMQNSKFLADNGVVLSAKPIPNAPGSSIHFHTSLYDNNNVNLFAIVDPSTNNYQQYLYYAVGGLLNDMPKCMSIFAPTDNCYKRYILDHGSIFKHHPTTYNWGVNNRTCAIRIPKSITGSPADTRIEHRVCSPLSNPYDALTCIINSIGYGICKSINPPNQVFGDSFDPIYADDTNRMSISLIESKSQSYSIPQMTSWV